ncbi:MAG: cytochrome P460 family protein [Myxococcales bacterium]
MRITNRMTLQRFQRLWPTLLLLGCLTLGVGGGCDSAVKGRPNATGGTGSGGAASATGGADAAGAAGGAGGAGGQNGNTDAASFETIMSAYLSWQPQSEMPVDISIEIFALCRAPTAAEKAFTDSVHSRFAVRDWANPGAAAAIAANGAGGFPSGAAIVKQKFAGPSSGPLQLAALGMMVKRASGSFPDSDDWEFAYWNASDGLSTNAVQLATCVACHKNTPSATDYVFLDGLWHKPDTR